MEPIKRVPLVHQVEERIKDLIKEEKLQPGTKLPTEKELCTNLNVVVELYEKHSVFFKLRELLN